MIIWGDELEILEIVHNLIEICCGSYSSENIDQIKCIGEFFL